MRTSTSRRLAALLTTAAIAAPVAVLGASSATAIESPTATASQQAKAVQVTPDTMIKRAKVWMTANGGKPVPYSQTSYWKDGFRQDCSGYVSMAARLGAPGTNTVGLASSTYSNRITMAGLKKGDIIVDANGTSTSRHVVIFEKWVEGSGKKSYWAYEQRGTYGTTHRKLSYGVGSDQYDPYRLKNVG